MGFARVLMAKDPSFKVRDMLFEVRESSQEGCGSKLT